VVLIVKKKGRGLQVQYPNFMARYPSGNDNRRKAAFSYRSPSDPYYLEISNMRKMYSFRSILLVADIDFIS
jgi:hypothetical protein